MSESTTEAAEIWPPTSACSAGAVPLNGTWFISMPALRANITAKKCGRLPAAAEA